MSSYDDSLNPCSNGRCSARVLVDLYNVEGYSLNPCSNGRCSASSRAFQQSTNKVLILVLMEDALRGLYNSYCEVPEEES